MATYVRRDDWLQDSMGNVITGVDVYVCTQPSNTHTTPPTPLATIYSDPLGANPVTQPLCSDGAGHVEFYAAPGIYTLLYTSPQIQTVVLSDQCIVQPDNNLGPTFNSDSSTAGTITPAPDGVNRAFNLSTIPSPATSLVFMVNGIVQTGWTLVYATVSLAVAPQIGDVITALYQVA